MVTKIHQVTYRDETDRFCVMGCAGASTYIDLFREYIGKEIINRRGRSYFDALDEGIKDYAYYVKMRSSEMGMGEFLQGSRPQAIFVGYDPNECRTYVYVLEPPDPPNEIQHRGAIGTGGIYANLLLGIV